MMSVKLQDSDVQPISGVLQSVHSRLFKHKESSHTHHGPDLLPEHMESLVQPLREQHAAEVGVKGELWARFRPH